MLLFALFFFVCAEQISNSTKISAKFNREEKYFRHVAMVEKSALDLDKPWTYKYGRKKTENLDMTTWMIALRNETVAHTFLPSFDNANNHLWQTETAVRSRNFAAMVT